MKVNCDYCGSFIESTDEKCPNCGAVNTHFVRTATDTPTTIEELKAFCASKNLPLDKMHVHIGEDYRAPKAFGIYKDEGTGHFIVYKNKGDGTRAVRYEGSDEQYAVNELYMKIKDLIMDAREATSVKKNTKPDPNRYRSPNNPYYKDSSAAKKKSKGCGCLSLKWIFIIIIVVGSIIAGLLTPDTGYYHKNGNDYYCNNDHWYQYIDDEWKSVSEPDDIDDDDFVGKDYDGSSLFDMFPAEDHSADWSSGSSYDWDSDDDWDGGSDYDWSDSYDSYDYGGGDWDSDW